WPGSRLLWSPDGRFLAATGSDGGVHIREARTGRLLLSADDPRALERDLTLTLLGNTPLAPLASLSQQVLTSLRAELWTVPVTMTWAPDSRQVALLSRKGVLDIYDVPTSRLIRRLAAGPGQRGEQLALLWSPDGRWLAQVFPSSGEQYVND